MTQVIAREALPDRLRGIALLGIVLVNVPYLALSSEGFTAQSVNGGLNSVTAFLVLALAQGKFYLLFSFLFGYSSSFILRDQSRSNRWRFVRRLIALLAIGLAHAVFFFIGDILITYALLGFGLLALSRRSTRALTRWVISVYVFAVVVLTGVFALLVLFPESETPTTALNLALTNGTFWEAAQARLELLPAVLTSLLLVQGPMAFVAFLLGLIASRSKLLADPTAHLPLWRKLAMVGLGIGLPLQILSAWLQVTALQSGSSYSFSGALGLILGFTTAPLLTAGYIGAIATIIARRPHFLRAMAPAGRTSLSVYIGESVILSLFFSGYGLGFFGQWGAFGVTIAAILTWAVLSVLARLWLTRFSRGPLEIILYRVTGARRSHA